MDWTDEQRQAFRELMKAGRAPTLLGQPEVAEKTGVAVSTISAYENRGPYDRMRWADVVRLCEFYDISMDRLLAVLGHRVPDSRAAWLAPLEHRLAALDPERRAFVLRAVETLLDGLKG